jgi:hypothetical protein
LCPFAAKNQRPSVFIGQVSSDVGQVREQSSHHEHKAEQTEFFDDNPYSQGVGACRRRIQFAVV